MDLRPDRHNTGLDSLHSARHGNRYRRFTGWTALALGVTCCSLVGCESPSKPSQGVLSPATPIDPLSGLIYHRHSGGSLPGPEGDVRAQALVAFEFVDHRWVFVRYVTNSEGPHLIPTRDIDQWVEGSAFSALNAYPLAYITWGIYTYEDPKCMVNCTLGMERLGGRNYNSELDDYLVIGLDAWQLRYQLVSKGMDIEGAFYEKSVRHDAGRLP